MSDLMEDASLEEDTLFRSKSARDLFVDESHSEVYLGRRGFGFHPEESASSWDLEDTLTALDVSKASQEADGQKRVGECPRMRQHGGGSFRDLVEEHAETFARNMSYVLGVPNEGSFTERVGLGPFSDAVDYLQVQAESFTRRIVNEEDSLSRETIESNVPAPSPALAPAPAQFGLCTFFESVDYMQAQCERLTSTLADIEFADNAGLETFARNIRAISSIDPWPYQATTERQSYE